MQRPALWFGAMLFAGTCMAPAWGQHEGHAMPALPEEPEEPAEDPHAGHAGHVDHAAMGHGVPAGQDASPDMAPREPIPVVTPADRAAAFPDVAGHAVHDTAVHSFWLVDRLEAWDGDDDGTGVGWEAVAWIGTDLDRLWLRTEGERVGGHTEAASLEVLYGRAIAPWWDLLAGVRHESGEGPSRTFAAVGVTGLSPYLFALDATAYFGEGGQAGLNLEAEYETLFTNRLIGQWRVEATAWGKDDPSRRIGAGLSTVEAGFRLRYEIRREFAPYIGVAWERAYGDTADLRRAEGIEDTRLVAGARIWF